eukprot:scaffold27923_cov20-Tisochrysis_lutea.AAC.1
MAQSGRPELQGVCRPDVRGLLRHGWEIMQLEPADTLLPYAFPPCLTPFFNDIASRCRICVKERQSLVAQLTMPKLSRAAGKE